MSINSFGRIFRFTTWGESHGPAIGCVIDGVPSMVPFNIELIQENLDRRRPGRSKFTTQRTEDDKVEILSGIFENVTTGAPISAVIFNKDRVAQDYEEIKTKFRPGHADYVYTKKYGIRDYRGGGRSSARETAMRVVAGSVAHMVSDYILRNTEKKMFVKAAVVSVGTIKIDPSKWDWNEIEKNDFFCPDRSCVAEWEKHIDDIRLKKDSVGAVIECVVKNPPIGLGEPIYGKYSADIAGAMMSINAVKAVEIGLGTKSSSVFGTDYVDQMINNDGNTEFISNNSGGIVGGISTGQDIVVRVHFKPTSSIGAKLQTVDIDNKSTTISTHGRHDPCVALRAVPIVEAMMHCVTTDHILRSRCSVA